MSASTTIKQVAILGSTGSIGESTLAVIKGNADYAVYALSAHQNIDRLYAQCLEFDPVVAVVSGGSGAKELASRLLAAASATQVLEGADALNQIASATDVDIVMAAIVGSAGLESTLSAASSGKKLLLANKEALVMSGNLLLQAAQESGALLVPIDSEHSAIFQCLPRSAVLGSESQTKAVKKIVLTASGGPFLNTALAGFATITPEQACKHPTWSMGNKISVDSATLMNKGLEFIEASLLFGIEPQRIEVIVHPQSIVHSFVYYVDGSVLAQLGVADMRVPIAYGLAFPQRIDSGAEVLDLAKVGALEFFEPDLVKFPCLGLGIAAASAGGTAPTLLNAANEIAVSAFLSHKLSFLEISRLIDGVLNKIPCEPASSLAIIREADLKARNLANNLILKGKI
ncbi:MAG: 1-deoxy-D-xylulose-5-phosphate reductoisomerase [Pseudohongiellaceae bacterium]|jgi:1-deoxy-D-xylulose-5-phosphate reductoisomerase